MTGGLRGASTLLGPEAVHALTPAVAAAGGRLERLRASQVHYQPDRRLLVRYAAEVVWGDGSRRAETLGAIVDPGGLPDGLAEVEGPDAVRVGVWRYPHDPFLPGLPRAAYPLGAREVLARVGLTGADVGVTPLVYRPGTRAVLRADVGRRSVYVKVVRPGEVERLRSTHAALAPYVPVPRCLGWSDPLGLLVLEGLPGRPLTRPLVDGGPRPSPDGIIGLLDNLRDAPVHADPVDHAAAVAAHARLLRRVLPPISAHVDELAAAAGDDGAADRTVHGDFYEAQVLVDVGRVTGLLDVDGARRGTAVEDLATLVGHLAGLAHVRPAAAARIHGFADAVAVRAARRVGRRALERAVVGVLLGLATTPFRRQEPDWVARTRGWLDLAATWADRSSRGGRRTSPGRPAGRRPPGERPLTAVSPRVHTGGPR